MPQFAPTGLLLAALLLACAAGQGHAASGALAVSATVLSKNNCKFSSNAASTLAYTNLDPSGTSAVVFSTTRTFECKGSSPNATFFISASDGSYASGAGARRMRHATLTSEYLPYSLDLTPTTATVAKNTLQTLTMTVTITPSQFGNVVAGSYSDTVTLTLTP